MLALTERELFAIHRYLDRAQNSKLHGAPLGLDVPHTVLGRAEAGEGLGTGRNMPTMAPELAEEIITSWRTGTPIDGWDNPAGPLFPGSEYAEQEITMTGSPGSRCSRACAR